jgi:hypothetical protein
MITAEVSTLLVLLVPVTLKRMIVTRFTGIPEPKLNNVASPQISDHRVPPIDGHTKRVLAESVVEDRQFG